MDELKRPGKIKHEERTQENAEMDVFYCKIVAPEEPTPQASVHPMVVGRSDGLALAQACAPLKVK